MNEKRQTTIYVPEITCESCEKLISKKLKNEPRVNNFTFFGDGVKVEHEESLKPDLIVGMIKEQGFRASTQPIEYKTMGERVRDMRENKDKYAVESSALGISFITILVLFILEALAYIGFLRAIPNFLGRFGIWLVYLDISVAAIGFAVYHLLSYRTKITCMVGMMIGMTFGMQAGLLIGAVLGATNGFFVGATAGMLIGVLIGAMMGKSVGVMGVMEGMMAGVMGGTMGAMTSYMMLSDHIALFMPIYVAINIIIIAGLSYMFIQEAIDGKDARRRHVDALSFISAAIIITAALIWIMAYGPRSVLLGG